jgi:hypothetical protein
VTSWETINFYRRTLLHIVINWETISFYRRTLLHIVISWETINFYKRTLLHIVISWETISFYKRTLLHTVTSWETISFYRRTLLHTVSYASSCTHMCVCVTRLSGNSLSYLYRSLESQATRSANTLPLTVFVWSTVCVSTYSSWLTFLTRNKFETASINVCWISTWAVYFYAKLFTPARSLSSCNSGQLESRPSSRAQKKNNLWYSSFRC